MSDNPQVIKQGLWEDVINPTTGEHSLHTHTLKVVKEWCPEQEHTFSEDIPKNRRITCTKCGVERLFIVGKHQFIKGKLSIRPDFPKN